ncbi:hypothetical protein J6590_063907 [Homalodisca vitripennis]|nr:hypothetical protein J6590_063907 [Homalodisca vitripennis]
MFRRGYIHQARGTHFSKSSRPFFKISFQTKEPEYDYPITVVVPIKRDTHTESAVPTFQPKHPTDRKNKSETFLYFNASVLYRAEYHKVPVSRRYYLLRRPARVYHLSLSRPRSPANVNRGHGLGTKDRPKHPLPIVATTPLSVSAKGHLGGAQPTRLHPMKMVAIFTLRVK